jgi:hypothetical protein
MGENRITSGGKPIVTLGIAPALVEPGGRQTLTWHVSNATSVQVTPLNPGAPALALPTPVPIAGSITLAPVTGLSPITGQYRLTATNACGATTADAEFSMRPTPKLAVTRIEVVQGIQTVTNSVSLVSGRRTAVRVFVDSGITDGFDFGLGLGPNRVGGLEAGLLAENLTTGAVFDCGSPWVTPAHAGPGLDRDVLADSINFDVPIAACAGDIQFRATVLQPGLHGAPPTAFASGSVDVSFTSKSDQMLLPFLITDPSSSAPAPQMTDFYACLMGPTEAHPFPRFVVHQELPFTISGAERLSIGANWSWLVMRIQTMSFLFASQPTGGVRMAIVPNDPSYPWSGMALPRTGAPPPAFLVKAGAAETCTHELGHAAGLLHVNCGGASGPYGGLPLTISDPGLNVFTRTLTPTGRYEAMSYCHAQWPSIPHWEHMFTSVPFG